ncbi:hypothetical protein [Photorhabdus australis]|uniref:hypothetical protein n=1 Tax=Photorhabdus australis TaxID=286156 RepID=UPI0012FE939C|nr:hypothetical protein [Photorhabdus australis]
MATRIYSSAEVKKSVEIETLSGSELIDRKIDKYLLSFKLPLCWLHSLTPGHIVIYAPGDSLPCRRDAS